MDDPLPITGGCLCGAVRFRIVGPLRAVLVCHCEKCRRQHTLAGAYTACDPAHLAFDRQDGLAWYRSSPSARRGFCATCGAGLFWQADAAAHLSVSAGAIDRQDALRFDRDICTDERPAFLTAMAGQA